MHIKGTFQPSNELLLKFYGYFKQATCGVCNKPRPGMFKVVERAKWDAWNSVKDLSKNEAMNSYIEEIKNV
jgi:acyl-CoA-binding protein